MVSLQVYDAQYVGQEDNWAATARRMEAQSLLRAQDAALQTTCKRCARCNAFVQASPRGFKHQKWRLCMLHGH